MKKNILILICIISTIFCCYCGHENKKITMAKEDNSIVSVEFRQNPAMDYFFTRKYKLASKKLYYYDKSSQLVEMDNSSFLLAKKIIDSLPHEVLNKRFLGHTTVDVDIPDWTMDIVTQSNDTVFLASGGLPKYMESYNKIVWKTLTELDNQK